MGTPGRPLISRRELLAASAALPLAPKRRRITNDLRVRECAVRLEGADVRVLTGIPASELAVLDELGQNGATFLDIGVEGSTGILQFEDLPPRRLEFMNGGEGFVTAWAFPISWPGYIGYCPHYDIPPVFAGGDGEFWRLSFDRMRLPRSLESARAVHVTFLTSPEVTLQDINERILQMQAVLPPEADLTFTANVEPHLEPAVLVSLFGTRG